MLRWLLFWRPPCLLKACIVNLKDDKTQAIKGLLWSVRGPWLTFHNCSGLQAAQNPVPIDGEVVIHRSNIAFIQVAP